MVATDGKTMECSWLALMLNNFRSSCLDSTVLTALDVRHLNVTGDRIARHTDVMFVETTPNNAANLMRSVDIVMSLDVAYH